MKGPGRHAALVPPGVVTVMSTGPAAPPLAAGDVATHPVEVAQVTAVAGTAPKATLVEPVTKPVPPMATLVPPATGPATGATEVTAGALK